ncbi:DnaJ C-terminal domain-containing protein [Streptomyces sp. NBC_00258]|uniref:DnaJ C-terminal domain-containing protein n=1 Tax=Streptomyces sp. NBC_00258 TaxID=2903642 RepID=UPI002E2CA342|nr:DnaJ C-terminal domain-containing protein [Streptomyces sp. NBC_00258]
MSRGEVVLQAARAAAATIQLALQQRLLAVYGPDWLTAVNERRRREGYKPGRGLDDHRFCLFVFGHDPATVRWAEEHWRRSARQLGALSNRVVHDETLTPADEDRAQSIARAVHGWSFVAPSPVSGKDVTSELRVTAWKAALGDVVEVRLLERNANGRSSTVKVRLPIGVTSGQLLRVPGRGAPGTGGGPNGDLFLRVRVEP